MKTSHIQIIVKKIMALEPNLILVGNNVSKHALDLFLRVCLWSGSEVKLDVSVAVNCDAEMMKQISRMTGAKIVKHLDDVARRACLLWFLSPSSRSQRCDRKLWVVHRAGFPHTDSQTQTNESGRSSGDLWAEWRRRTRENISDRW